jgi:hypothetical protein
MAVKWRSRSESERWRREQQKAEMIAAEVKRGTAHPGDIAWLKEWKRRQKGEQWQGVQASRTARTHRETSCWTPAWPATAIRDTR